LHFFIQNKRVLPSSCGFWLSNPIKDETRFIHLKAESSQRLDPVFFTAPNPEGYFLIVNQG
jgi:hypothetical protein